MKLLRIADRYTGNFMGEARLINTSWITFSQKTAIMRNFTCKSFKPYCMVYHKLLQDVLKLTWST